VLAKRRGLEYGLYMRLYWHRGLSVNSR
jgi:hypothetical protein